MNDAWRHEAAVITLLAGGKRWCLSLNFLSGKNYGAYKVGRHGEPSFLSHGTEGGKGNRPTAVHFRVRPNPLAH
jgi:hypothetical protein